MKTFDTDVLVIGGGPAGLAAAVEAKQQGAQRVLVLERNAEMGGILTQCIHNGFGLSVFGDDLTGPEYVSRWIRQAEGAGVEFCLGAMVLAIEPGLVVVASSRDWGLFKIHAKALVLAMGCRERSRGALAIPGTRPAGVYTAGTAQRLVNVEGYMPGERYVILGSGDIGMIMARRLTLEGAQVVAMLEILPYISGLRRNLVQCVRDFDIPLQLCTTVTEVKGRDRVEAVIASQVDARWRPIDGTQQEMACDSLLLSVGLIPENELSRMAGISIDPKTGGPFVDQCCATNVPGIYAAGNVVHVYDLVDEVTENALLAGRSAATYAQLGAREPRAVVTLVAGENVHHVVPQTFRITSEEPAALFAEFRVRQPVEAAVRAQIKLGDQVLYAKRLRYARPSEMVKLELGQAIAKRLVEEGEATLQVDVVTV